MQSAEIRTVRLFNEAINRQDAEALGALMTPDHIFFDAGGGVTRGLQRMKDGWQDFFRMFPDYRNEMSGYLQDGNTVMAYGQASGTYDGKRGLVAENRITMPAAWRAVVHEGRVKEWQVYADWTEGLKIIEEDEKAGG